MAQGKNKKVNGPHQGAWVDTQNGEDWFLHFQDKHAYGRVVHLQPAKWVNDWLVIGDDKDPTSPAMASRPCAMPRMLHVHRFVA